MLQVSTLSSPHSEELSHWCSSLNSPLFAQLRHDVKHKSGHLISYINIFGLTHAGLNSASLLTNTTQSQPLANNCRQDSSSVCRYILGPDLDPLNALTSLSLPCPFSERQHPHGLIDHGGKITVKEAGQP